MKKEHRMSRAGDATSAQAAVGVLEADGVSREKNGPWLEEAVRTLDALRKLAPNWDSYGAEPPAQDALQRAREVLEALDAMCFRPDRVAASAEGEVSR